MVKRVWFVLVLFVVLLGGVIVEQVYTDNTYNKIENDISLLQQTIESAKLENSKTLAANLDDYWSGREVVLSLFVDYRDIEQIGRQLDLIKSHLSNEDLELATVECNLLKHIVQTYHNTIGFDWQNII